MADILALLIVFGLLAALVGTLATGVVRLIGFGILVALALIIGTPVIRGEMQGQSASQNTQEGQQAPATAPQSPPPTRPSTTLPSNTGSGGVTSGTPYQTTGDNPPGGTQNSTNRGVRAMW